MFKNLTRYLLILNILQITPVIYSGTALSQSLEAAKDKAAANKRADVEIAKMATSSATGGKLSKVKKPRPGTPHLSHRAVTADGFATHPMPPLAAARVQAASPAPVASSHTARFVDVVALAATTGSSAKESVGSEAGDSQSVPADFSTCLATIEGRVAVLRPRSRSRTVSSIESERLSSESLPSDSIYKTTKTIAYAIARNPMSPMVMVAEDEVVTVADKEAPLFRLLSSPVDHAGK